MPPIAPLNGLGPLTAAVFSQALVGFVFGFVAFLVFVGIQFAGEMMDLQVGFSIVNVINPLTSQNVSILGEFQLALGLDHLAHALAAIPKIIEDDVAPDRETLE